MTAPALADLIRVFGRIGLLSFGGPAAQIALMHKELVEDRSWMAEKDFLGALSFCMLLPGPEAMQLATYSGWRLHGVVGGLIGGGLFVLPGAVVIAMLALLYAEFGDVPLVEAMFIGIKATVVMIVLEALLKIGRRALKGADRWLLAGLSFLAIHFLAIPFPAIVAAAALYGFATSRGGGAAAPMAVIGRPRTLATVALWGALWLLPVVGLWAMDARFLTDVALFFSKLAVVTFGGAYAVLAYMTQAVVTDYGWIDTAQMIDGLGLAETTPGPLILVTQFVAMLAGEARGGPVLALAAGGVALWVTFVPCFLWIFAGAPYVEWLTSRPRAAGALSAIIAAVVGVILNLSVWFALHVLFQSIALREIGPLNLLVPDLDSFDPVAAVLSALAGLALFGLHWPMTRVLLIAALAGGLVGLV